ASPAHAARGALHHLGRDQVEGAPLVVRAPATPIANALGDLPELRFGHRSPCRIRGIACVMKTGSNSPSGSRARTGLLVIAGLLGVAGRRRGAPKSRNPPLFRYRAGHPRPRAA